MYFYIGLGLLAVIPIIWMHRQKANVKSKGEFALLCVLYSVLNIVATMLFAQIESLIAHGEWADKRAMSSYGFYFIGPLLMIAVSKLMHWNARGVMDVYALCGIPTFIVLRVNCLQAGCCGGIPLGASGFCFPTRETEIVFYLIMFIILWRMIKKDQNPGRLFPILMVSYGTFRFLNQWFRDTGDNGLHIAHLWSALCVFLGFSLLFEMKAQAAKSNKVKKPESRRNKK